VHAANKAKEKDASFYMYTSCAFRGRSESLVV